MRRHTESLALSPEIGKTYTFRLNDVPLYNATIDKAEGCWATITVVRPLPGKFEKQYRPGQQFDVKVAYYELEET